MKHGGRSGESAANPLQPPVPDLQEAERVLGVPVNSDLLQRAFTHPSYVNEAPGSEHNERLEFLGDAVLDLVIAEELYRRLPAGSEGDLSRIRAAIVCTPTLSTVAGRLGLGPLLRLGRGEEATSGRERPSILCAVLEAVVGALYLEQGFPAVKEFVLRHLEIELQQGVRGILVEDYKTFLQVQCQSEFRSDPVYRVTEEEGPDHDRRFTVEVVVQGHPAGEGTGRSRKEAEQAAAQKAAVALFADAGGGTALR
ncbi:MAG: ribonuclease III [Thermaerobacterales bacterium]